jgi:hypothetical protein
MASLYYVNLNSSSMDRDSRTPYDIDNTGARGRFAWDGYRLLFYSGVIGIAGGLVAQLFVWLSSLAERLLLVGIAGYKPPEPEILNPTPAVGPWGLWLIPVATIIGSVLLGILVYTFAPEAIAKEIAGQLGPRTNILDAGSIGETRPHEAGQLAQSIEKADGFAQVFPEHKFHIVDVPQRHNHIVGMTGDGVNDAPALKKPLRHRRIGSDRRSTPERRL